MNKRLANKINEFKGYGDSVARLIIEVNNRININILYVYALTTSPIDESIKDYYETQVDALKDCSKSDYQLIIRDYSAKIGKQIRG